VAIQVACPSCSAVLKTAESYAGKRAKCPKCGAVVQIPELPKPEPEPEEEEILEPELTGGMLDFSDEDYQLEAPAAEPPKGEERKPCPMCGELIAASAVKCRHCGEIFDPTLKKQAKKKDKGYVEDEDMTAGEWALAVLCSSIACILAIIWIVQGKPKGTKMLLAALAMQAFWVVVRVALESASQP
jgi:predicted RNA-binding Zn-ribbon protein involved in translation (DUF1610 family)